MEKYIMAVVVLAWLVAGSLLLLAGLLEHGHTASLWVHAAAQWIKLGAWIALCTMGVVSMMPLMALSAVYISKRWVAQKQTDQR
jgi:hypothetical protein